MNKVIAANSRMVRMAGEETLGRDKLQRTTGGSTSQRGKRKFLSLKYRAALATLAVALVSVGAATGALAPDYYVDVQTSAESRGIYVSDSDYQADSATVSVIVSNNLEDPRARGFASAAAGPGSVAVISNSEASGLAPLGQNVESVGYNTARSTINDLIFTGPNAAVTASLNLFWSGLMDHSVESLNSSSYTNSNTTLDLGGSIRRPNSTTFLSFSGYRGMSMEQVGLNPQDTWPGESGILSGAYPPSGPLVTELFNVPTDEPLSFKLSMASFSGTGLLLLGGWSPPTEGSASSKADFGNTLSLPTSGPVFNLPQGFTANSVQAGIVNNQWTGTPVSAPPIPGPSLAILSVVNGICHLTWSPAGSYTLQYSGAPAFDFVIDTVDVADTVTEYDYNAGTETKGFFRLVPR